jgi:uracil-DNA glycosylase
MLPKPSTCNSCPLECLGAGFMDGEGTGSSGIMIIGEALGQAEARDGLPFRPYAPAGSVLTRILKLVGLNRQELRIVNCVWCQPPNDFLHGAPYEYEALKHCEQYWLKEIEKFRPRVILALGETATRTITGMTGHKKTITHLRGYPLETPYGTVLPTYHPSFIVRGKQNLIGVVALDFLKAQSIAKNGYLPDKFSYVTHPTIQELQDLHASLLANPDLPLAFDIETVWSKEKDEFDLHTQEDPDNPDSQETQDSAEARALAEQEKADGQILSIQFSIAPGTAVFVPWIGEVKAIACRILQTPNPKIGHNAYRFDIPRLRAAGVEVRGEIHDTMWMFHHLQPDLSGHYNLQSVASFYGHTTPWKHLSGSDSEFYGCVDVDVLQKIWKKLPDELKAKGIWDGYQRHIVQLEPVLQAMSGRGIPVNNEARLQLGVELSQEKKEVFEIMQELVPDSLKNLSPKEGYVKTPKDTTGMVLRVFNVRVGEYQDLSEECKCKRGCKACRGTHLRNRRRKTGNKIEAKVERFALLEPFTPSNPQMLRYIREKGHPVQIHPKEDRETADTKALNKLSKITKDPLYRFVLDYRQTEKILSTYVEGWVPDSNGRVHPQFLYKPATGQLSSVNPNVQNSSAGKGADKKKAELAARFRRIIEALEGHVLIEADYHSFHGMTTGFEAGDEQYMRLARLDMHSFLTSYLVKEPAHFDWPDDQLMEFLNHIKGKYKIIRDTQAKPTILGAQFGMQANTLWKNNEELIHSKAEAQKLLNLLDSLFPKVKKYKVDIVRLAHSQKCLVSKFGYVRRFWEAMKWDSQVGGWIKGAQAEQAMAFLPANDAFGHKKEAMLTLRSLGLDEKYGLINEIHDSLVFCCLDRFAEECCYDVKRIMEAPSKVLVSPEVPDGLAVEVEIKMGRNWAEMEEIHG